MLPVVVIQPTHPSYLDDKAVEYPSNCGHNSLNRFTKGITLFIL